MIYSHTPLTHRWKRLPFICIFPLLFPVSAIANSPVITDQQMSEAESLFSGPGEEDYYRTDAELVSATGSAKPVFLAPSVTSVISK